MEALPITPARGDHQPAKSQGFRGLGELFEALLHEASLRLEPRAAMLPSFEARGPDTDPYRSSGAETFPPLDGRRDRPAAAAAEPAQRDEDERYDGPTDAPRTGDRANRPPVDAAPDAPTHSDDDGRTAREEIDARQPPGSDVAPSESGETVEQPDAAGLPAPAVGPASEVAAGKAQALNMGETALQALARAAAQAKPATAATPSVAVPAGANGAAVRVEVIPAMLLAPPRASLGGGAALAALAASATQTTQQSAQPGQSDAGADPTTASGRSHLAAAVTAAAQLQPGALARRGQIAASSPGQGLPSGGESAGRTAQGIAAQVRGEQAAAALAQAAATKPAAASDAPGVPNFDGSSRTARESTAPGLQNVATPSAHSGETGGASPETQRALLSGVRTSEAGAQNGLAQNARAAGEPSGTTQSSGAPLASGAETKAASPDTVASQQQPQTQAVQRPQPAPSDGAQLANSQAARPAGAVAQGAPSAALGLANAPGPGPGLTEPASNAVSFQRSEGATPVNASMPGGSSIGPSQAAAHTPAALPSQARPAALPSVPVDQVAVHIQRAAAAGQDRVRIRLHPAELGQVDVQLKMAGDGVVKAVVSVDRPETFELLQRDARGLERALQDAGLKTDSGSLSFNLRGETQTGPNAERHDFEVESRGPDVEQDAEPESELEAAAPVAQPASDQALDIRV